MRLLAVIISVILAITSIIALAISVNYAQQSKANSNISTPVIAAGTPTGSPAKQYPPSTSFKNIAYARNTGKETTPRNLDIYQPSTPAETWPVIVLIHGGSWSSGDKASKSFINPKLAALKAAGYLVVSINYRLLPEANGLQQASDCANAISWVKRNIHYYRGNPNRIGVIGYSAGAQLALLVASDQRLLERHGLKQSDIKSVVTLDAVGLDLVKDAADKQDYLREVYLKAFGKQKQNLQAGSVFFNVGKADELPPLLLIYSGEHKSIQNEHKEFADKLSKLNANYSVLPQLTKTHETINSNFGLQSDETTQTALQFLAHNLL